MPAPRWQRLIDDLRRRDESTSFDFDEDLAQTLTLGRFIVLDRIGSGGMGAVFEAIDPELDRRVALKVCKLPPDHAARMIEHEARCLAQLAHPNVVTIHDVVRDGPDLILVMEHVQGNTLRAWQRVANPSWRAILDRYCDAARGLAAAHQQGLEHGDFKPDNVLLGDDGRVRVIDFGIARHSYDAIDAFDENAEFQCKGTRSYMAPERLREQQGDGVRADVYGFCVSVWESLYAARPFAGETTSTLTRAIEVGEPGKGEAPVPGVPAAIEAVLRRGLSVQPSERPASIEALVEALDHARGADERRRARRWQWARWSLVALAWLGLVILLIVSRREPVVGEREPTSKPDAVAQTLALALDAAHEGLPDAAIQYLELARARARVDDDDAAMREIAVQAEGLGDEFERRGDREHAEACWDLAGHIFDDLPHSSASAKRVMFKGNENR